MERHVRMAEEKNPHFVAEESILRMEESAHPGGGEERTPSEWKKKKNPARAAIRADGAIGSSLGIPQVRRCWGTLLGGARDFIINRFSLVCFIRLF